MVQTDILTSIILPFSLFLIMFGLGLTLKKADFLEVFKYPKAVSIGLVGQMLVLPLVAFVLALLFNLSPELAVGLMIISLAPGGATSNMFSYLFKGDVALSISLTVLVSFITPFTIPLIVSASMDYFIGSDTLFRIPILKTIIQLLVITVVPVLLGMFVFSQWASIAKKLENFLKWFSIVFFVLIVILIIVKNSDNMLSFFIQAGAATLFLNILALTLGYQLAKIFSLSVKQSITIGFEVGIQNGTLAMVVAGSLIGNITMTIPAITYGLLMFASGAAFGVWLNYKNKQLIENE